MGNNPTRRITIISKTPHKTSEIHTGETQEIEKPNSQTQNTETSDRHTHIRHKRRQAGKDENAKIKSIQETGTGKAHMGATTKTPNKTKKEKRRQLHQKRTQKEGTSAKEVNETLPKTPERPGETIKRRTADAAAEEIETPLKKREIDPKNDTQKTHEVNINRNNGRNPRNGIHNWNNTFYMVSALQIIDYMDRPQEQEIPNIQPLLNHILTQQNLTTEQKKDRIQKLTQQ